MASIPRNRTSVKSSPQTQALTELGQHTAFVTGGAKAMLAAAEALEALARKNWD